MVYWLWLSYMFRSLLGPSSGYRIKLLKAKVKLYTKYTLHLRSFLYAFAFNSFIQQPDDGQGRDQNTRVITNISLCNNENFKAYLLKTE